MSLVNFVFKLTEIFQRDLKKKKNYMFNMHVHCSDKVNDGSICYLIG